MSAAYAIEIELPSERQKDALD